MTTSHKLKKGVILILGLLTKHLLMIFGIYDQSENFGSSIELKRYIKGVSKRVSRPMKREIVPTYRLKGTDRYERMNDQNE